MTIGDTGEFCWIDVKSRDVAAAKDWFSELFGWRWAPDARDWRRATKASAGDHLVASISDLASSIYPPGLPDHVAAYLCAADLGETCAAMCSRGAQLIIEPFDAGDQGRVATVIDPQGAAVSLWQPDGPWAWHHPHQPGAPQRMAWIGADPPAAESWYRNLPGMKAIHAVFTSDANATHRDPNRWVPVIGVTDPAHTIDMARELGSAIRRLDPSIGAVTVLRSPTGIEVAVEKSADQLNSEPS